MACVARSDKSNLQFSAWSPGEPTEGHHSAKNADGKASLAAAEGEDAVHMTFVQQAAAGGAASHWDDEQGSWNDNHVNGEHGHNENNAFGFFPLCQISPPTAPAEGSRGSLATAWVTKTNKESCDGKYVAIPRPLSWTDAHHYCTSNGYYSLASIHSWQDQAAAVEACKGLTGSLSHGPTEAGSIPHGCWIGMHDSKSENAFEWRDATYVNYHAWAPGEPNSWGQRKSNGNGGTMALDAGEVGFDENYVEMDFRGGLGDGSSQGGAWNDAANTGLASVERAGETAGQCFGCHGTYGLYPLCERRPPSDSPRVGSRTWTPPKPAVRGRFVAVPVAHKWTSAESVCHTHNYCGLASIHTMEEQRHAEAACHAITHSSGSNTNSGLPNACWIGLNQRDNDGTPGQQFRWTDGTTVEFQHFSPGEPNNWGAEGFNGAATGNGEGEVGVEIAFIGRGNSYWQGYWNDDHDKGTAGHNTNNYKPRDTSAFDWSYHTQRQGIGSTDTACFGCSGVFGQYALCNAQPAATCNPQTSVTIQGEACPTGVQVFTEHCCNPALTCHQELDNADGVAPVAACCNLGTDALTGKPVQPRCHVNMCHNDGQFTEVDFPVVDDMCGCIQACLAHPQASSYQYNAGGWCGCLENTGDDLHNAANTMTDAVPGACSVRARPAPSLRVATATLRLHLLCESV
jgi:hypothetical protein